MGLLAGIQWLTMLLVCANSKRLPLLPIAAYVFAVYLPTVLFDGLSLLPVPFWIVILPMAAGIACAPQILARRAWQVNGLVLVLLGLVALDVACTYALGRQWAAYAQLIGVGLALTSALVVQDRKRFVVCVIMLALYSAGVSYGFLKMGGEIASGDVLGTDAAVNRYVGDRNYKSFECGLGVIIGVVALLSCGGYLGRATKTALWVGGAALLLVPFCGYAFLETQSRGGIIALSGGLVCAVVHRVRNAYGALLIMIVLAVALGLTQVEGLLGGFSDRFQNAEVATLNGRLGIWEDALDSFQRGSVIEMALGRGVGSTELQLGGSVHNSGLRILMDQGVLGLALCLALAVVAFARSWRRKDDVGTLQFGLLAFSGLTSISIEPHYFIPASGIVLGLAVAHLPVPEARLQTVPAAA